LNDSWFGARPDYPSVTQIRSVIGSWDTAAIVVVASPGSQIARLLTRIYGGPTFRIGGVLSWKLGR
jgi:hypothetical protein